MTIFVALAFAGVASASITPTYDVSPSTTQAAGHPDTTYSLSVSGDALETYTLSMAPGTAFNWAAPTSLCTSGDFYDDDCPSASQVGTATANITFGSATSVSGTIYELEADTYDVGTLGIVLRPSGKPKMFLVGHTTLKPLDAAQVMTIDDIPDTHDGSGITFNSLDMVIQARANSTNSGAYFNNNTHKCSAASTDSVTVTAHNSSTATTTDGFTATGCGYVDVTGSVSVTPSTTVHDAAFGVTSVSSADRADQTIQYGYTKTVQTTFPADTGISFPALGALGTCSNNDLMADNCPSNSDIGDTETGLPFLPPTWYGDVYITSVGNSVQFAVVSRGPGGAIVITKGSGSVVDIGEEESDQRVRTTLTNVPQQAVSSTTTSISAAVLTNPSGCQTNVITTKVTGWSGDYYENTSSYDTTGC
ncbi:MAG: hypothetical protein ACRDKI_09200 [Solirubrobacterales bacterium]